MWGALIGVILAAMSSGYAFGGWAADRYRVGSVLAWSVALFGMLDPAHRMGPKVEDSCYKTILQTSAVNIKSAVRKPDQMLRYLFPCGFALFSVLL